MQEPVPLRHQKLACLLTGRARVDERAFHLAGAVVDRTGEGHRGVSVVVEMRQDPRSGDVRDIHHQMPAVLFDAGGNRPRAVRLQPLVADADVEAQTLLQKCRELSGDHRFAQYIGPLGNF